MSIQETAVIQETASFSFRKCSEGGGRPVAESKIQPS